MTTPDWPSLWEREPGLKPEGLEAMAQWLITSDGEGMTGKDDVRIKETNDAALCRDAAVRWLGKIDTLLIQEFNITVPMWKLSMPYGHEPFGGNFSTLDEALYTACSAILDVRDLAITGRTPIAEAKSERMGP